jgi:DNA-binding Xre family transcriptional regulator
MKRQVSYRWRLRELMAAHNMFATVDLVPLLQQRGITLSVSQVHRLATGTPERLSLPVLAALCDIFECTAAELIPTTAESVSSRKAAGETKLTVVDPAAITPKRARLRPAP